MTKNREEKDVEEKDGTEPEVQAAEAGAEEGPELTPEQQQAAALVQQLAEEQSQMFVKDEKHVNCPVAGVTRFEDGTMEVAFQVGHNHFQSYRIGQPGQKAISDTYLQGAAPDIVIAGGPLPPPDLRTGPGRRPRR
jgi:hypothetical protein